MYQEKHQLHVKEKNRKPGSLRTIVMDITPRCNMRCEHCYAIMDVKPVELDYVKKVLDEAYDMGVTHYVLMGGEPILAPERVEFFMKHCRPDESYITVTTNGWNMTREKIRWLKSIKVDKISVSLDSGLEEEHDAHRVKGSYKRVMEMVDNVLAEGLIVSLDVVVTHQSLYSEGFNKAYEIAKEKGIRLDLQIAEPVGNWEGRRDILITPEDAEYIKKLREEGPLTIQGELPIKRDIFSGKCDHCPAGTGFMHIAANGDVFPCNFLQFTLGNIREKSLKKMRADLLTCSIFKSESIPHCLCGEDDEFIDKYIMPYVDTPKPLDAYKIFDLPQDG